MFINELEPVIVKYGTIKKELSDGNCGHIPDEINDQTLVNTLKKMNEDELPSYEIYCDNCLADYKQKAKEATVECDSCGGWFRVDDVNRFPGHFTSDGEKIDIALCNKCDEEINGPEYDVDNPPLDTEETDTLKY